MLRLLASGFAIATGFVMTVSRCSTASIPSKAEPVSASELAGSRSSRKWRHVYVRDGKPDWTQAVYWSARRLEFYRKDPRVVAAASDPTDLLARTRDLLDGYVAVSGVPKLENHFWQEGRRYDSSQTFKIATHVYAPVPGFEKQLWIVSERVESQSSPKAKEFIGRTTHVGMLAGLGRAFDSSLLVDGLRKLGMGELVGPGTLAVITEDPLPERSPVELWAPVEATNFKVWVASPDGSRPEEARGVLEWVQSPSLDAVAARLKGEGVSHASRAVIVAGSPADFRKRKGIERVSWPGLGLLFGGLAVGALSIASRRA